MKRRLFNILFLTAGFSAFAVPASIPEKLDVLLSMNENPEQLYISALSKTRKPQKEFTSFVKKYSSVIKHGNQITFFYFVEKATPEEKLFIYTNLSENRKGTEMNPVGKTGAFYKTMEIPENTEFLTYSFRKSAGFFYSDPNNPLCYSDSRKSSLIRLSEKTGAFVKIRDYEKSGYKKIPKRVNVVYLPAAYFSEPEQTFPVIYWLDGQNLWDNPDCPYGGWKVDSAMERLVKEGRCRPFIIAGLTSSAQRTQEYAGWAKETCKEEARNGHDVTDYPVYAEEHAEMIVKDYIPFIEANFRTAGGMENRFITGSSYGAFLSAWLLNKYPEVFSGAGLFSGGLDGYSQLMEEKAFTNADSKIYLDCGTAGQLEKILLPGTRDLHTYLINAGYQENREGGNFFYQECDGLDHTERSWSERVPDFLEFISK